MILAGWGPPRGTSEAAGRRRAGGGVRGSGGTFGGGERAGRRAERYGMHVELLSCDLELRVARSMSETMLDSGFGPADLDGRPPYVRLRIRAGGRATVCTNALPYARPTFFQIQNLCSTWVLLNTALFRPCMQHEGEPLEMDTSHGRDQHFQLGIGSTLAFTKLEGGSLLRCPALPQTRRFDRPTFGSPSLLTE